MKKLYTFKDLKDKSKEGIRKEVSRGLARVAFYFQTTLGVDKDIFTLILQENCANGVDAFRFYMNFRNEHPNLFDDF